MQQKIEKIFFYFEIIAFELVILEWSKNLKKNTAVQIEAVFRTF